MPLDLGTLEYVREQMTLVEPVVAKRMFGGAGFYARGLFFALIDDDTVYFKTDDANRADYLAVRSPPFSPFGEAHGAMDYHELPDQILDNPTKLKIWMEKSIEAAERARGRRTRKSAASKVRVGANSMPKRKVALEKSGKMKKIAKSASAKKSALPKKKKASRKTP